MTDSLIGSSIQFSSIVIEGLGFDTLVTLLLTSGTYVAQVLIVLFSNAGSSWIRNTRTYFMAWNLALAIVGCAMIRQIPHEQKWARYAGNCLSVAFTANFPLVMAMVSGNFGGFTKKMTVNSMVRDFPFSLELATCLTSPQVFIAYCAGNIIGPQLFFADEAPTYQSGFLAMMVCFGVGIVLCFVLRASMIIQNRKRDRSGDGTVELEVDADIGAALDRTDKQIPQFRYVY